MRKGLSFGCVTAACAASLLLGGCADKLTRERYEMIVVGTSDKYDVEKTIGPSTTNLDEQWHYERVDRGLNVFVHFNEDDIVTRKQWVDADSAEWHDTQDAPADRDHHEKTTIRTIDD